MKKIFQKIVILLIAIIMIISFDYWLFSPKQIDEKVDQGEQSASDFFQTATSTATTPTSTKEVEKKTEEEPNIPDKFYLDNVPFVPQAPEAIWDDLHNEACEEAALIIVKYWLENKKLTVAQMDEEILSSVAWQKEKWGGHYDLPAEKVVDLGREYFGIKEIRAIYNINDIEEIKKELIAGNLVLVPCAGRLLDNSNYRQPGPVYHMLVIRGFDKQKKNIITNDPGTRRGENFRYSEENLFSSIYDWPAGITRPLEFGQVLSKDEAAKEILKGQKVMIVVEK